MKKRPGKSKSEDDLRAEYDLSKLKMIARGIYAERFRLGTNLTLDLDVRNAFPDDKSVNDALRVRFLRMANE